MPESETLKAILSAPSSAQVGMLSARIQSIVAERIGCEAGEVDINDDVDLLGLDSLTVAEVSLALEAELGITIVLPDFVGTESIADIAARSLDSMQPRQ
jgi:acyl carrier protein